MKKYVVIAVTALSIGCTSSEKKEKVSMDITSSHQVKAADFKDDKLEAILTGYLSLKDALVASKADTAKTRANELAGELKTYSGCENTSVIAERIANAKDLSAQRKEFTGLSNDLIALFKHADLKTGKIYVQHCPMANGGDGGDWLSAESKIQNPYYGSEMLECGAVVSEIKAK